MLAALLTTLLFSISAICGQRSAKQIGGVEANFWRICAAAVFLAIWANFFGTRMNGEALPVKNGAPIRVRIERQLGYKMAKYIMRIELVSDFKAIGGGNGGYWEDQGYEWYAGI